MSANLQSELDNLLSAQTFLCDASCGGVISRPRLWWSNVITPPHASVQSPLALLSGQVRWRRANRIWELIPNSALFPRQVATSCPFARFHEDVTSSKVRFPCLTTPADAPEGRDAPTSKKRRSESPQTLERWRAASRRGNIRALLWLRSLTSGMCQTLLPGSGCSFCRQDARLSSQ